MTSKHPNPAPRLLQQSAEVREEALSRARRLARGLYPHQVEGARTPGGDASTPGDRAEFEELSREANSALRARCPELQVDGADASCSCPDFEYRGACAQRRNYEVGVRGRRRLAAPDHLRVDGGSRRPIMFWKKKPTDPAGDPRGVPLSTLLPLLQPTSIKARLEGSVLIADHGMYSTRVEVVPPDPRATGPDPIRAVVRVLTTLPIELSNQGGLATAAGAAMLNSFSSLGAVTAPSHRLTVGSRLTIFEGEDQAWAPLHLPLLAFTILGASEAVLGGFRRALSQLPPRPGRSDWTDGDLSQVQRLLSRASVCTGGAGGLTAEFGLVDGAVSAAVGHRATSLFQMTTAEGHPEMGGGLFCLLRLPHVIHEEARLQQICEMLNTRELDALGQPPHFGAWCPDRMGNGLAYVCFLPNVLHRVAGIASNVAVWSMHRARWASAALAVAGVKL